MGQHRARTGSEDGDFFSRLPQEVGRWEIGPVFLKDTITSGGRLDFGIGTYFVPEGTGHEIERALDIKVRAAVSKGGSAVIKDLLIDGVIFNS